jgi:hypothetical protein
MLLIEAKKSYWVVCNFFSCKVEKSYFIAKSQLGAFEYREEVLCSC